MSHPVLSLADLFVAAALILANGLISVAFRLGLERRLLVAALRMIVQLAAVGFVLRLVFAQSSPLWTVLVALVMVAVAGYEVVTRPTWRFPGLLAAGLGTATLLVVGISGTIYATALVIGTEPWYAPRVFLPVLGMILGNALTAMALVLETLTQAARSDRAGIEARIALGHPWRAVFEGVIRRALTTAMLPMLNAMSVAGVVSLPGMMTGQILSGVEPVEAAKYQIMIMFVIAGTSALAAVAVTLGGVRLLTDSRGRLRLDRLRSR